MSIRGIYIVSSAPRSRSDYAAALNRICHDCHWGPIGLNGQIVQDDSNVWVHLMPPTEFVYDDAERQAVERVLGGPANHILQVEFDDGEHCKEIVVTLATRLLREWPIAFDDCMDTIRGPDRIVELQQGADF